MLTPRSRCDICTAPPAARQTCSRPLLEESERLAFLAKMRNPRLDGLQKKGAAGDIVQTLCRALLLTGPID